MTWKERLKTIAKWAAYPVFYFACLGMFGYLTFPWDQVKDRIINEFHLRQSARAGSKTPPRLEIDHLDSYWFSGLEATGVRVVFPPEETPGMKPEERAALKESVIAVDEVEARVRILPLIIGRVKINFDAKAFGGTVEGTVPIGSSSGPVEMELDEIDLKKVEAMASMLGVPVGGVASGKLSLAATDGKFNKASGSLDLTIKDASVGDGVTKIKGSVALPEAKLGDVEIAAEAKDGVLRITKFTAPGKDLELVGDGKIAVREPWNDSNADLYVRFKFSDAYKNKNETTKSIFVPITPSAPALFELIDPKVKKAKRPDGFYGWHVHGALKRLKFDPTTSDGPASKSPRSKPDTPASGGDKKRTPSLFPLGTSTSGRDKEEPPEAASPPPAAPPPAVREDKPEAPAPVERPAPPPPAPAPEPEPVQEQPAPPDRGDTPDQPEREEPEPPPEH